MSDQEPKSTLIPPPPPPPPPLPLENKSLPNKIMTFAAIAMGVGFGTCSVGAIAFSGRFQMVNYVVWLGAGIFFVGLAVLFITGLYMVVTALWRSFRK